MGSGIGESARWAAARVILQALAVARFFDLVHEALVQFHKCSCFTTTLDRQFCFQGLLAYDVSGYFMHNWLFALHLDHRHFRTLFEPLGFRQLKLIFCA